MGNYPSQHFHSSNGTAVILDTSGNTRRIKVPVKSAEIMIEEPGHVIAPVDVLRRTRRIWALPADEELVGGKAYLLVPTSRVQCRASESEIAIIQEFDCMGKKKKKKGLRGGNMAKVIPIQIVNLKEEQDELKLLPLIQISQRLGKQARWNPVLEPILESP